MSPSGDGARRVTVVCLTGVAALTAVTVIAQAPAPAKGQQPSALEQRAARHFERIREDPPALRAFLQAMPKGADLHSHLSGAVYAESYIQWAADMQRCVDLRTFAVVEGQPATAPAAAPERPAITCAEGQRPAADALLDPVLYRSLIDALSTRFWSAARKPGHYQFFDSFLHFGPVVREGRRADSGTEAKAVAEVIERAALQNVAHVELMMSFSAPATKPLQFDVSSGRDDAFRAAREALLAADLRERLAERRQWLDRVESERQRLLSCGTADEMKACGMSVRYMAYALRGLPPNEVFAQALFAFELAAADPRIAGVNLVMPEDWFIPMRDHALHMRMYGFLRQQYPAVNVALHAGELTLGLVPPEKLGSHVRQAIGIAGAQRIGHATDVMYDSDPAGLLRVMASRRIAVEISLSSSDLILGVRGPKHPLRQFLRAGVPVVIATDDEGVARSDLTNEYQRAVEEHGLDYLQVKRISRNSIEFSFLPAGEKSKLAARLEAAFAAFEASTRRP